MLSILCSLAVLLFFSIYIYILVRYSSVREWHGNHTMKRRRRRRQQRQARTRFVCGRRECVPYANAVCSTIPNHQRYIMQTGRKYKAYKHIPIAVCI